MFLEETEHGIDCTIVHTNDQKYDIYLETLILIAPYLSLYLNAGRRPIPTNGF